MTSDYVTNVQTDELDRCVLTVVNKVNFSQELKKVVAPMRFRKRLVKGLNEALKAVTLTLKEKCARLLRLRGARLPRFGLAFDLFPLPPPQCKCPSPLGVLPLLL